MSLHDPNLKPTDLSNLSKFATTIGFEIVDIEGFLDEVEALASEQRGALNALISNARTVAEVNKTLSSGLETVQTSADAARKQVSGTVELLRSSEDASRSIASWVGDVSTRTTNISSTLDAVKENNQQIVSIAKQVNTLAVNAKIEAARAGDAGRGFSVVADAINELSQQTASAAVQISTNIDTLTDWIVALAAEASETRNKAELVLEQSRQNDQSLTDMERISEETHQQAGHLSEEARRSKLALNRFKPCLQEIGEATRQTTAGISETHQRLNRLIDTSETIVQTVAAMGGAHEDGPFIDWVQSAAAQLSQVFENALKAGRISEADLLDTNYEPVPHTDPPQVMTRFTRLTDELFPPVLEEALLLNEKVVFCAAVDRNGYLPTHNKKFSQPQSGDVVWNTANCRNRRIFDDRVGLKAGRNTHPFLLQIYRRDMGGGSFAMMKDISAPIYVAGQHWGGLRLAVRF